MGKQVAKARRRWVAWLTGAGLGLAGTAAVLVLIATRTPGWYRPPVLSPEDYPLIRNELPTFGSEIGAYLKRGQPFRIILTDENINRWITARERIWPGFQGILPACIEDPVVSFQPGRIVAGVRYTDDRISSVLSLAIRAELDGSGGAIRLRFGSFRAGLLPVPRMLVEDAARRALARAIQPRLADLLKLGEVDVADALAIDEAALAGWLNIRELPLPTRYNWPNGNFPFHVSGLTIEQGRLLIDLTPSPRQVVLFPRQSPGIRRNNNRAHSGK